MILSRKPLPISHLKEHLVAVDESKPIHKYVKDFGKLSKEEAEKLISEINGLKNQKIRDESVVKIVDFLPQDSEEINKIFSDVSLTEEESNAILEIVKKY